MLFSCLACWSPVPGVVVFLKSQGLFTTICSFISTCKCVRPAVGIPPRNTFSTPVLCSPTFFFLLFPFQPSALFSFFSVSSHLAVRSPAEPKPPQRLQTAHTGVAPPTKTDTDFFFSFFFLFFFKSHRQGYEFTTAIPHILTPILLLLSSARLLTPYLLPRPYRGFYTLSSPTCIIF